MRYPAYPEYKESGVQWLGQVPEHWEVKRLKYSATINDEALPETTDPDFEFSYVDIGSVNPVEGITNMETMIFENAPSRARRKVAPGDTIVSTVRTYLRAIAPIPETSEPLIVSTGFAVIRPRKLSTGFLAYALRESCFVESVVARSTGVSYPAVNASEIGNIEIPLPAEDEQTAIADFLDRETGRIDTLVAKKRRLIALLKEKRTVLISRTVTRGLPASVARKFGLEPHTRFKDSGIEWLGQVPEGWEVKKLGFITKKIGSGKTPSGGAETYVDEGIMFLRSQNVYDEGLNLEDVVYIDEGTDADMATSRVQPKDVLLNITGASLGRTCIVPDEFSRANVNQHVCIIRMSNLKHSVFISWLMKSAGIKAQIQNAQTGAAREGLNFEQITNLVFVLPPLSEQTSIATYLDRETAKIDRLVEKVELLISRLQEYRAALITAAVTGKIDVRSCTSQEVST